MLLVRPRAGAQVFFTGLLLCLLMLLWTRAAVLLWALFFGVTPFPGLDHLIGVLFGTAYGWTMLVVGTAIGGLFAAFAFAISVFAVPMLLDRRVDALTAMGTSMKLVWNNLVPMVAWGAMVLLLFAVCVATGPHRDDRHLPSARPRHLARLPGRSDAPRTRSMTCRAGAEAGPLVGLDREIRAREIVLAGGQNPALAVGYNSLPNRSPDRVLWRRHELPRLASSDSPGYGHSRPHGIPLVDAQRPI